MFLLKKLILTSQVARIGGEGLGDALVGAVDELGTAVGEDVDTVVVAVEVADELWIPAEVVDVVLPHDFAQQGMVHGREPL